MNIQIMGTRKNRNTQKAERWFKERGIPYQIRLLNEKGISPRELDAVLAKYPAEDILDTQSKSYTRKGLAYMEFDAREEILEEPLLLKMPIVRNGSNVTVGVADDVWKNWVENT
ncbi:arsenate reductase family protein [Salinispira pacifica]|uniref:Putative arsenate reductase n=1 Tax=Salinispira pacifica TaxID=1307761 RepID=V5WMB8_9SPIO|nr:ArsC/Spx/MgsR family protein [Salinispira pacifica]AHC16798.1 Putative arsenate reductase [Salinispira pacifica]